ncbi:MAG: hypothetical protein LC126_05695 [Bryobacterales bacterium]|nr:hypothetical protein [Bryobacterales bacterium]
MHRTLWILLTLGSAVSQAQVNPCDLNRDGAVNAVDVQLSINMFRYGLSCATAIYASGACNDIVTNRVVDAAFGKSCITGIPASAHRVSLNWTASTSPNIIRHNVYRGTTAGGPYTMVATVHITGGTSYIDTTVQGGGSYYYVVTAVDSNNRESAYSREAAAKIPQ